MKFYYKSQVKLIILLLFVACFFKGFANNTFIITNSNFNELNKISSFAAVSVDAELNSTLQDAIFKLTYEPTHEKISSVPQSKKAHWYKITIHNQSVSDRYLINIANPIIDNLSFYQVDANNNLIDSAFFGEYKVFSDRQVQDPEYIYRITILKDSINTFYIKISGLEDFYTPLFLASPQSVYQQSTHRNLLLGIYAGFLLVMIFYNLFIYFSVKDNGYVLYVIYILIVLITQLCSYGIPFQYIWPNNTWLQLRSLIIFPALSGITGILFMQNFLHLKQYSKWLNNGVLICIALYILIIITMLMGYNMFAYKAIQSNSILVSLFMLATAIYVLRQGSRPAGFFLASWSFFLTGIIFFILKDLGIIPYNNFTNYAMQIGSAAEVVLLSFALGDRINILKKEKEKSQAEVLDALRENERIITEQNIILEQKVEVRTEELTQANLDLSKTLKDLKDTQSQLVDHEKMASLGQLTAGIAHEINNPINFVTSNVNPLKRDFGILTDLLNQYEQIALSNSLVQQKEEEINKAKKEIDLDYLVYEINYLLKGIGEGASRTAEIVKGLRIFSRLDEDLVKKADVIEGIESTIIIINNQLNKITLQRDFTGNRIIDCYPGKLNQVFLNLLSNAIYAINVRFNDTEGGTIYLASKSDETYLYLTFKDNGIGMDEETMNRVFEPFFTTKPVGDGTGLGMSIVFKTIEQHNGTINVTSKLNEGTEFNIKLPLVL